VEGDALGRGVVRLITHLLPERTRILYDSLAHLAGVSPLGAIASSGIGYVTGKNDFFHLSATEAAQHRIPSEFLIPAIRRSAWLTGLSFTERDWRVFAKAGQKCRLLTLTGPRRDLPAAVKAYLETGQAQGVHEAYKCRTRDPWYKVPHVVVPDLFLSYMANARPALAVNDAQAVANNTLLCVRLHPLAGVAPHALAAGWWTSLAALSAEIEGHSLGGGMLKLEPGEAVKVLIPLPSSLLKGHLSRDLSSRLDVLVRRKAYAAALDLGDQEILRNGLGLSSEDCSMLRKGFTFLMDRRRDR